MSKKLQYRVTSQGLEDHDYSILKSLINLLNLGVNSDWIYTEDNNAEVVMVDLDTDSGRAFWNLNDSNHNDQLLIPISSNELDNSELYSLKKPLRSASLRQLFNSLINDDGKFVAKLTDTETVQVEGDNLPQKNLNERIVDRFVAAASLDEGVLLNNGRADFLEIIKPGELNQPTRFENVSIKPFVIHPEKNTCFITSDFGGLKPLSTISTTDLKSEALSGSELENFTANARRFSLITFYWFSGIMLSQGRLLKSLSTNKLYRLNRWPDFGRLPHNSRISRMATELITKPVSIEEMSASPKRTLTDVINFVNACYLCGWLQEIQAADTASGSISPAMPKRSNTEAKKVRGIVSKLRAGLRMRDD